MESVLFVSAFCTCAALSIECMSLLRMLCLCEFIENLSFLYKAQFLNRVERNYNVRLQGRKKDFTFGQAQFSGKVESVEMCANRVR